MGIEPAKIDVFINNEAVVQGDATGQGFAMICWLMVGGFKHFQAGWISFSRHDDPNDRFLRGLVAQLPTSLDC